MFDALAKLFARPEPDTGPPDTKLAVAALLVHLAAVDGEMSPEERQTVARILEDHFELTSESVAKLIAEATRRDAEAVDFYQFTATLARLEDSERLEIIRLMWQVVFADGQNHELEDNMVWRVAELIGISSRQRTILRNKIKRAQS